MIGHIAFKKRCGGSRGRLFHSLILHNNYDHLIDATLPVQKNPYPHEHIEMQYRKLETHVKNQLNSYYKCATPTFHMCDSIFKFHFRFRFFNLQHFIL